MIIWGTIVKQNIKKITFYIILLSFLLNFHTKSINNFFNNPLVYFSYNFHTVEPGKFYRCKQVSPQKLQDYIKRFGIKTIINLRGTNENQKWWQAEKALATRYNVLHIDINLSADKYPTLKELTKLIETFKIAPQPILVHCRAGADRTGLAAALWVIEKMNGNKHLALKQLSTSFGHLKTIHPKMSKFIDMWCWKKAIKENPLYLATLLNR